MDSRSVERPTKVSLTRLELLLEDRFAGYVEANPHNWEVFKTRLGKNFPKLFPLYLRLYEEQGDFNSHLEDLIIRIAQSWIERPEDLKVFDETREVDPYWYQSNQQLGGVCYVDLFAGNLNNLRTKIPYFKELGLTFLHLMPIYHSPESENDGGYAVSSYREFEPEIGDIKDLIQLARELRKAKISLVLDFIFNTCDLNKTFEDIIVLFRTIFPYETLLF